jgi:hypothetical protein
MTGPDNRSVDLPPAARSTRDARRFVDRGLTDWGLAGLRDTVLLLTSELVTNSVLHARSAIHLAMRRDRDGVTVEVSDSSVRGPVRRQQSDDATTGRGIDLLEQLASAWDVTIRPNGKTIRFSVSEAVDPWAAYTNTNWLRGTQR